MKRFLVFVGYGIGGIVIAMALSLGAFALAGRQLGEPATPVAPALELSTSTPSARPSPSWEPSFEPTHTASPKPGPTHTQPPPTQPSPTGGGGYSPVPATSSPTGATPSSDPIDDGHPEDDGHAGDDD